MIVISASIVFLPFLIKLPSKTRNRFLIAGGVYIEGALIIEIIQSIYYGQVSEPNGYLYLTLFMTEECGEMVGIALFIAALLHFIRDEIGILQVNFAAPTADATALPEAEMK